MKLKTVVERLSMMGGNRRNERSRSAPNSEICDLALEIEGLAPNNAHTLLKALKHGLSTETAEWDRYIAAETLSTAIYPKYKFSEYGRLFLEDREFISYYEHIMDPGNWHSFDRKYTLRELLRLVEHLDGDMAECGAYKGASAYLMCKAAESTPSLVHLFDSFEGLADPLPVDGSYWQRGSLTTPESALHATLEGLSNYRTYKGWIPDRFGEIADRQMRFVHIDVDLYEATLSSLNFFYPNLVPGGIFLLDDYGFSSCPGAKQAADEFFAAKPEQIAMLPTGQAIIVKQ
ncbi:TylF/MycF/NovP-related O-methyltransferase [Bosea minatitlanensis]|uniref:TylF/MycF/NovP-related O-methyltransferase n=1 Tax=Bosea minatitlanensis TaxID=128782 RepID=A0ABW0FAB5_9HYPH|nr:TylF/MycF/NovP-related O-methyltransferase [Bosea minatitlanensis]MCT4493011.1 TylF/MycF family methyltransferase [Bosea minatitlanensis]